MEASQGFATSVRPPLVPNPLSQRSYVKDTSHQRPGFSRRVRSWSESISKRAMRSTTCIGHKRYTSTTYDQQTSSRSCSPYCWVSSGAYEAATQPSQIKKSRTTGSDIYHTPLHVVDEHEHQIRGYHKNNNEKTHYRVLSTTKMTSHNSPCNSSSTSSCHTAELTSKGSNSVSGKFAQSRVPDIKQPQANASRSVETSLSDVSLRTTNTDVLAYDSRIAMILEMPPSTAEFLKSVFQDVDISTDSPDISNSDVKELIRAADFMFATQSYHDSFKICQKLWSFVGPVTSDNQSRNSAKPISLWLLVAVGMVKSAQTPDDYIAVAHMMRHIPKRCEWPEYYKTNDYCMLYAFLSSICLDLADFPQAEKACLESWKHCQTLITKRPLVQHILSTVFDDLRCVRLSRSATEPMGQKIISQFRRRMTVDAGIPLTARDLHVLPPVLTPTIDQHVQEVLTWCVQTMSQQEVFVLIANIDVAFWSYENNDHDVREFERNVVFCYLSEQLRHFKCSQKHVLDETHSQSDILWSFEQICDQTGITKMDILAAITKALSIADTTQRIDRTRATLPERYLQLVESVQKDMIIHNAGYARTGQQLTSQTLFQYYEWPGRPGRHEEQYHDPSYGRCVENFLREFTITSLELGLTERLGQAFEYFTDAKSSQDKANLPKPVERTGWSDDYRAFETVARDICGDAAVRWPLWGSEECISPDPNGQVLFKCCNSRPDFEASNSTKQEKQAFKTRNKGAFSGWTLTVGSIDTNGSSMMDFE